MVAAEGHSTFGVKWGLASWCWAPHCQVQLFSLQAGNPVLRHTLARERMYPFTGVHLSADGEWAAFVSYSGHLHFTRHWDLAVVHLASDTMSTLPLSVAAMCSLVTSQLGLACLAWSPDNHAVLVHDRSGNHVELVSFAAG